MSPPSMLRDRQRTAARAELTRTAMELFVRQGFEATTIDQIVNAVGISRRSFFRYFGSKEDVVLGDLTERGAAIAAAVSARPAEDGPWEALRAGLEAGQPLTMPDRDAALDLGRMLLATPALQASMMRKRMLWQDMLIPLVAQRLTGDPGLAHLKSSAIVAAALACLDAASSAWVASDATLELADLYDIAVAAIRS